MGSWVGGRGFGAFKSLGLVWVGDRFQAMLATRNLRRDDGLCDVSGTQHP